MTQLLQATRADVERFMRYVEILPSGCWFWSGARSRGKDRGRKWYGSFRLGKRTVRAHRFACEVIGGERGRRACPPGHDRDHECQFTLCVNPDHVKIITKPENRALQTERARARRRAHAQLVDYCAE